jgi:hypothetical protein
MRQVEKLYFRKRDLREYHAATEIDWPLDSNCKCETVFVFRVVKLYLQRIEENTRRRLIELQSPRHKSQS